MDALEIWGTPKLQYIDETEFCVKWQGGEFNRGTLLTLTAVSDLIMVAHAQGITIHNRSTVDPAQLADRHEEPCYKWACHFSNNKSGGSKGGSDS